MSTAKAGSGWARLTCTVAAGRMEAARIKLEQWGALSIQAGVATGGSGVLDCDFPGETHPEALHALLREESAIFPSFEIGSYPRQGAGRAPGRFEPYEIVPRIVVVPAWAGTAGGVPGAGAATSDGPRGGGDILLDPGGVFGTGQHHTSALCAGFMAEIERSGPAPRAALDAGTGTGILALLAARLGIERVIAVENDPGSVEVARANVARNRFAAGRVHLVAADLKQIEFRGGGLFDLAIANLLASILTGIEPSFRAWLAPEGQLIASGIMEEQVEEVLAPYEARGWATRARAASGGWAALWLRRAS